MNSLIFTKEPYKAHNMQVKRLKMVKNAFQKRFVGSTGNTTFIHLATSYKYKTLKFS